MNEFSDFAGDSYSNIIGSLSSIDTLLGGEPIVCFHNMNLEHLNVEVGFPVAEPINGSGEIKANIIPSQRVVSVN